MKLKMLQFRKTEGNFMLTWNSGNTYLNFYRHFLLNIK
jgi:hypothetical protein